MSARTVVSDAFWSALCHLFSRGSLMAAGVYLARQLDTVAFAQFGYFQLTVSMLATYSAMGLGVAASYFFAQADCGSRGPNQPPLGTLWVLSVGLAISAFCAVLIVPAAWLSGGLAVPRWLLALGVLVLSLQIVPDGAVLGLGRYRQAAVIAAMSGTVVVAGACLSVRVGDVRIAMLAVIVASSIQSAGCIGVAVSRMGRSCFSAGFPPRRSDLAKIVGVSGPMFLVTLLTVSGGWWVGRILLRAPGGQREFALFSIGLQWFALGLFIPGMISRVVLPRLVRSASTPNDPSGSLRLARSATSLTIAAAAFIACCGLIFGPWLSRLYGARYQAEHSLLAVFLAAAVVGAPTNTLGNTLLARDGQWMWLGLTVLWGGVLIGSANALRAFGARGAGAAYVLAYATMVCGTYVVVRRRELI